GPRVRPRARRPPGCTRGGGRGPAFLEAEKQARPLSEERLRHEMLLILKGRQACYQVLRELDQEGVQPSLEQVARILRVQANASRLSIGVGPSPCAKRSASRHSSTVR